jgi:hypothetical protein
MDDAAALRRTLRRCTAALLAALGLVVANTDPDDPSGSVGYPLALLAVASLGLSLLGGLLRRLTATPDAGGGEAGPPAGGDDGDDDSDRASGRPPLDAVGGDSR